MTLTYAALLSPSEVERVHEASLEILEEVGLLVRNHRARATFARHGCTVETDTNLVRFPRSVVEEFRQMMPSTFSFHGRDPETDRTIPGDGPLVVTGSSAPNIIDPATGEERRARSDDIARIAYLVNELPGYDVFSISALADDAPAGQFSLARFYPALKNCTKPVRSNTLSVEEARKVLRLGELIAGGDDVFRERPFVTFHYCPVVSPLTMEVDSTEMLMFAVQEGYPCYGSIVPNAGVSSPFTLAGTLAQCNAEFLALAVLMEMVRPGAPVIYATLPTVVDVRTGAYTPGAIETGILMMGCVQLARYYGVPSGGYIGLTNAKANDAQSGFETGMGTLAAVLAGADLLNMGGLLDALMTFDFAKAVIDSEIGLMLKRVRRGVPFDEQNLALDVISDVGPGGTFIDTEHTFERMRTTALLPEIADRDPRDQWEERGALDAQARAMRRVKAILSADKAPVFSPEIDARIRHEFLDLVDGDVVPPVGW